MSNLPIELSNRILEGEEKKLVRGMDPDEREIWDGFTVLFIEKAGSRFQVKTKGEVFNKGYFLTAEDAKITGLVPGLKIKIHYPAWWDSYCDIGDFNGKFEYELDGGLAFIPVDYVSGIDVDEGV